MNVWDRAWHGPVCATRPSLLARALLLVFAFDSVVLMAAHAARYGDGGFNVAHFGLLDALPVPTPGFYLAVLLLAGGTALTQALAGPTPRGMALALALQAYAWMMSRLDSYQHHYLLSLLLLCLALSSSQALAGGARRIPSWGFRLAGATLSLLYLFASIAKLEPGWAGSFLGHREGLIAFARSFGLASPERAMALGVGGGEIFVGLCYGAAALCPEPRPRWLERVLLLALAAAVGFHVGVELLGVKIGWFSVYAIAAAAAFFLPERAMARAGEWVARADAALQPRLARGPAWIAAVAGMAAAATGALVELPGSLAAGIAGAVLILAAALGKRRQLPILGGAAALLLGAAVVLTPVRFDYWRYAGADAMRRGDGTAALEAYRKAEAHAPAGQSRQDRIRELTRQLEP